MTYLTRYSIPKSILMCFALLVIQPVTASADTVAGTVTTREDPPEKFKVSGNLTSTDSGTAAVPAVPPDPAVAAIPPNNGLVGTKYRPSRVPNWRIDIWHENTAWNNKGAGGVKICMEGLHLVGPHAGAGPKDDRDPSRIAQFCSTAANQKFGIRNTRVHTAYKKFNHLLNNGNTHKDSAGITSFITASAAPVPAGAPSTGNILQGTYEVVVIHRKNAVGKSKLYKVSYGSSSESGSAVAYDAETQTLSFTIGAIDIMDAEGGISGVVADDYLEDPFNSGVMTVSDLKLMERTEEGSYLFGPGVVTVSDPAENYEMEGRFNEYSIDQTIGGSSVTSYALFDSFTIDDLAYPEDGASQFLSDFVNTNVMQENQPEDATIVAGIDFTFMTEIDLVEETSGFTISAQLPARYLISLNSGEEEIIEDFENPVPEGEYIDDDQSGTENGGISNWMLITLLLAVVLIGGILISRNRK